MGMILERKSIVIDDATCPHTHGDDPHMVGLDYERPYLSPHAWG